MKRSSADRLTRVEGDAPMGMLFRQYWLPVLHSERLVADGVPMRVRILGENFVAFRDSEGRAGMVGELCPHRGISLQLARNEGCGLRCIQHGWKIDAAGKVVEAPNMPPDAPLERIATNARPVVERHGIVWAWFGETENPPPLTPYDFTTLPEGHVDSFAAVGQCNWLQLLETLWDPFHVAVLHATSLGRAASEGSAKSTYSRGVMEFQFTPTDHGFYFHYKENTSRFGIPFVLPSWSYSMLGSKVDDDYVALGHIPVDDQNHLMWGVVFNPFKPLAPDGNGSKLLRSVPRKYDYRDDISRENLWRQDRDRMASGESFTGLDAAPAPYAVFAEDIATIESMGPICDRSQEHLAPTDQVVMRGRGRLLELLDELESGRPAPGRKGEALGVLPTFEILQTA